VALERYLARCRCAVGLAVVRTPAQCRYGGPDYDVGSRAAGGRRGEEGHPIGARDSRCVFRTELRKCSEAMEAAPFKPRKGVEPAYFTYNYCCPHMRDTSTNESSSSLSSRVANLGLGSLPSSTISISPSSIA
jgi:hypothetical protein